MTGSVTAFITNLPTGDHPTEQLAFKDGRVYWSQGSTTNSGVVGLDNGGGTNQSDIPCQDITLSDNVFISSLSPFVATSGYSPFGKQQKGAEIPAFFNSFTGLVRQGVCDGAILRSRINDSTHAIEAFSWDTGTLTLFASRLTIIRWQGGSLPARTGRTSGERAPPITPRMLCT